MNNNQNNDQNYVEEIDLRELIMILWKQKIMIISITLIIALLTGIFSKFILSPVYETNLNIVISMPEMYMTKYGEYKLPITTNQQYINLIKNNDVLTKTIEDMGFNSKKVTLERLKERISIGQANTNTEHNSFNVTVSADNPEVSLKLAECLYANYIEFLDVMIGERAVNFYYNDLTTQINIAENLIETTKDILKKNEKLLSATPQIINQPEAIQKIQSSVNDYIVIENIINPAYTSLENSILENKKIIIENESSIVEYTKKLEELTLEKAAIDKYYESGQVDNLKSNNIVQESIFMPSSPIIPNHKTSPSILKNVVIGGVLGGMLSVVLIFLKAYWKKEI
jgi:capsular polysaccharide biosynthesis protein